MKDRAVITHLVQTYQLRVWKHFEANLKFIFSTNAEHMAAADALELDLIDQMMASDGLYEDDADVVGPIDADGNDLPSEVPGTHRGGGVDDLFRAYAFEHGGEEDISFTLDLGAVMPSAKLAAATARLQPTEAMAQAAALIV